MSNRTDRRVIVAVPENIPTTAPPSLATLSARHFQSFMLLRDAAICEARSAPRRFQFSRFVPAAIIMLHATIDALINQRMGITLAFMEKSSSDDRDRITKIMRLSLSSTSQKARKHVDLYRTKRQFDSEMLEELDLLCDFRDVIFHSEPVFLLPHEFPVPIEKVCRRASVTFQRTQSWGDHAADIRVLEWAYGVMRSYFKEFELAVGGLNVLDDSQDGKRVECYAESGGPSSLGFSMEEMWVDYRKWLFPQLTG